MNKPKVILVVDDDPVVRTLAKHWLTLDKYHVLDADNGAKAVEISKKLMPDAILLDIQMPQLNGHQACQELRKLPNGGPLVPIVMLTGLDDLNSIEKSYEMGATDFIVKPVRWILVRHRIRYMIRNSEIIKSLDETEKRNQALLTAITDGALRIQTNGKILSHHIVGKQHCKKAPKKNETIYSYFPCLEKKSVEKIIQSTIQKKSVESFFFEHAVNKNHIDYEGRLVYNNEDELTFLIRDISDRKKQEREVHKLAYYDSLTGLANRQLLYKESEILLSLAREKQEKLAFILLDIDNFKHINDSLGHDSGDKLLSMIGVRMTQCLRKEDIVNRVHDDTRTARLGGDEFAMILNNIKKKTNIKAIIERILHSFRKPMTINGREIFPSASMGVSIFPDDGETVESLIKSADIAMYEAKRNGRNTFCFFSSSMSQHQKTWFEIEEGLRKALQRNELTLHYQPKLNLSTKKITSAEALMRWEHPQKGLVMPDTFISVAEKTGLIVPMGYWAIEEACRQLSQWHKKNWTEFSLSINISTRQFKEPDFIEKLTHILRKHNIPANSIELEIVESLLMENTKMTAKTMQSLKEMGVKISIDDFGTGYSSFSYLIQFSVNYLKIDRSFIKDCTLYPNKERVTKAIIDLAHNLDITVVAEGVEKKSELDLLTTLGCNLAQGYYIGKPAPADQAKIWAEYDYQEKLN